MTRKRKPPTETVAPPSFDDEPTSEQPLVTPDDEPPFAGMVETPWTPTSTLTTSAPVAVEVLGSYSGRVVAAEADRIRDAAAALVDEYVSRCLAGDSVGLADLRELRRRVAGL